MILICFGHYQEIFSTQSVNLQGKKMSLEAFMCENVLKKNEGMKLWITKWTFTEALIKTIKFDLLNEA